MSIINVRFKFSHIRNGGTVGKKMNSDKSRTPFNCFNPGLHPFQQFIRGMRDLFNRGNLIGEKDQVLSADLVKRVVTTAYPAR